MKKLSGIVLMTAMLGMLTALQNVQAKPQDSLKAPREAYILCLAKTAEQEMVKAQKWRYSKSRVLAGCKAQRTRYTTAIEKIVPPKFRKKVTRKMLKIVEGLTFKSIKSAIKARKS